jgi:hypothetical protein
MVKGGAQGLGMKAMFLELGLEIGIHIKTDASAAKGIATRRGMGKVRHIEVNQLWLQDRVSKGEISVEKIDGKMNLADHLTKYVSAEGIQEHMVGTGQAIEMGRHSLMPEVAE